MKQFVIIAILVCLTCKQTVAQKIIESYTKQTDSLRIGEGKSDFLPYNEKGYTLILPDSVNKVKGVIISLEDARVDLKGKPKQQIFPQAVAQNFAVLYISTGIPVDLYFSDQSLKYVDTVIANTFKKFQLPTQNNFFLGVNLAGHRALKYIDYYNTQKAKAVLDIKGVMLCDGVLDWVRQWYEEKKGVKDNFAPSAVFEGKMITYLLEKQLKSTPKTNLEAYLAFSTYSYFDESNRYLHHLKTLAVRAYTEPATYYWMNERRKGVFDTNFPDMVGIINELKLLGNQKAELTVFYQDKDNKDRRNPNYTWELVDKSDLMTWMVNQSTK